MKNKVFHSMLEFYCEYDPKKVVEAYLKLEAIERFFEKAPEIGKDLLKYIKTVEKDNPKLYAKLEQELNKSEKRNISFNELSFSVA